MIVFIDIETVPLEKHFADCSPAFQKHWQRKSTFLRLSDEERGDLDRSYRGHAGIYAEFSRVLCIGMGYYSPTKKTIKTTVLHHESEQQLLQNFLATLNAIKQHADIRFCGHNVKEFDLPFLCRRLTVHGFALPQELNMAGLKPWENNHIDTMELWRFGDYKRYTALDLLATVLNIPSSKTDIDGSQVANVFYEEQNLDRILAYCERDVVTTAKIYYRLTNQSVDLSGMKNN